MNHPREGGRELESKAVHPVKGAQIGPNRQATAPRDGILQRGNKHADEARLQSREGAPLL